MTETMRQLPQSHNFTTELIVPRHGVVTLFGYPIQIRVERAHLVLADGIGPNRRYARLPRVGHGLKRLVVIGSDGMVSLAALRWLSDQKVSLSFLERDGRVLLTTGPVRPSDIRLRRCQAIAYGSDVALRIARELVRQKLAGQANVARYKLLDTSTADAIDQFATELPNAETIPAVRLIEARAASKYFSIWRTLPITFPKKELSKVPRHWQTFGTRISPLTGSPRLAVTPGWAMMNYLLALVEAEASLAARILGLDAAMGVFHADQPHRESMSCDLMEPVRPQVDAYLLDWIITQPLKREWFFEQRDGSARLMASLTKRLAETAPTWGRAVAPVAEWVAQALWSSTSKSASKEPNLPTRLTQRHRSEGRGNTFKQRRGILRQPKVCAACGAEGVNGRYCGACAVDAAKKTMADIASLRHMKPKSKKEKAYLSKVLSNHAVANTWWNPSSQPSWLTEECYVQRIQPLLRTKKNREIAEAIQVSELYAGFIRSGRRRPHQRHWQALAELVGFKDQG